MFAECVKCNIGVEWKASRGSRLSDLRCPKCGGTLRGSSFDKVCDKKIYNLRPKKEAT